jgi:hypothetical protein
MTKASRDTVGNPDYFIFVASRRAGAVFFACHLDNFIVTQNTRPIIGTLTAFVKTTAVKAKTHANPDTPRYCSGQAQGNSLNREVVTGHS